MDPKATYTLATMRMNTLRSEATDERLAALARRKRTSSRPGIGARLANALFGPAEADAGYVAFVPQLRDYPYPR